MTTSTKRRMAKKTLKDNGGQIELEKNGP